MKRLRIYLACSIRGDRAQLPAARAIEAALTAMGHEVMTGRFLEENAENQDDALTEQQVFARDIAWLDAADVIVAEASGSTYGVGFEVGYMLARAPQTGQRVIVVYHADRRDRISRMISGLTSPYARVGAYTTAADAVAFVTRAVAEFQ